jgi:hypothetical protein
MSPVGASWLAAWCAVPLTVVRSPSPPAQYEARSHPAARLTTMHGEWGDDVLSNPNPAVACVSSGQHRQAGWKNDQGEGNQGLGIGVPFKKSKGLTRSRRDAEFFASFGILCVSAIFSGARSAPRFFPVFINTGRKTDCPPRLRASACKIFLVQKRENPPCWGGFYIPGAVPELGVLYAPTVTVSSVLGRNF